MKACCAASATVPSMAAVAEVPDGAEAFAGAAGVGAETLDRICTGAHRPPAGELAGLLERAGTGLRVRLEVYGVTSAPPSGGE